MIKKLFITLFFVFLSFLSIAKSETQKKISVVVSILPQKNLVEIIGGKEVDVTLMIPPGASPHSYEPKPSQLKKLSKAQMYVKVGTPIEFELRWMKKLQELNKNMLIVNMSKDVPLINIQNHNHDHNQNHKHNHNHKNIDPHIWLSIKTIDIQVKNILEGFLKIDGKNSGYYRNNYDVYLNEIKETLRKTQEIFKSVKQKSFMIFHPAFGYFARDFNLEQISVEVGGKAPTAKAIKEIILTAKKNSIKVIFVSPQFSRKSAEVIAKEIKGTVVNADPLAENYLANILKLAASFSNAMK